MVFLGVQHCPWCAHLFSTPFWAGPKPVIESKSENTAALVIAFASGFIAGLVYLALYRA